MSEQPRGHAHTEGTVTWRRTDGGIEIYDEAESEAWVAMEFEAGVPPEKRLFAVCPECGFAAPQRVPPGTRMICGDCGTELGEE